MPLLPCTGTADDGGPGAAEDPGERVPHEGGLQLPALLHQLTAAPLLHCTAAADEDQRARGANRARRFTPRRTPPSPLSARWWWWTTARTAWTCPRTWPPSRRSCASTAWSSSGGMCCEPQCCAVFAAGPLQGRITSLHSSIVAYLEVFHCRPKPGTCVNACAVLSSCKQAGAAAPPGWRRRPAPREIRTITRPCCMRTALLCALSAIFAHILARLSPQPQRASSDRRPLHSNFTMSNVLGNTWANKVGAGASNGAARSWGMPAPRLRRPAGCSSARPSLHVTLRMVAAAQHRVVQLRAGLQPDRSP